MDKPHGKRRPRKGKIPVYDFIPVMLELSKGAELHLTNCIIDYRDGNRHEVEIQGEFTVSRNLRRNLTRVLAVTYDIKEGATVHRYRHPFKQPVYLTVDRGKLYMYGFDDIWDLYVTNEFPHPIPQFIG